MNLPEGLTPYGPGNWWHEWVVSCHYQGRDYDARACYIDKGAGPFPPERVAAVFARLEQQVLGRIELDGYRARQR